LSANVAANPSQSPVLNASMFARATSVEVIRILLWCAVVAVGRSSAHGNRFQRQNQGCASVEHVRLADIRAAMLA
jgi:hypothetical protein